MEAANSSAVGVRGSNSYAAELVKAAAAVEIEAAEIVNGAWHKRQKISNKRGG